MKQFPLLHDPRNRGPRSVPWGVAERAYQEYARRYGRSQSLERLAERGGFSEGELDALAPGWREYLHKDPEYFDAAGAP